MKRETIIYIILLLIIAIKSNEERWFKKEIQACSFIKKPFKFVRLKDFSFSRHNNKIKTWAASNWNIKKKKAKNVIRS